MTDRDYIDPLALKILDEVYCTYHVGNGKRGALKIQMSPMADVTWHDAGKPLLTKRASLTLKAVEEAMSLCALCLKNNDCQETCFLYDVRNAWKDNMHE